MRWIGWSVATAVALMAQPLDLKTALQLAKQRHPLLQNARYIVPLARADSLSASVFPNPTVEMQYIQNPAQLGTPGGFGASNGQWQLGVVQTVDVAGQRRSRIEYSTRALAAAAESYQSFLQQVLVETALRWIDVWSAERNLAIAHHALLSADSLVAVNRVRLRSQAIVAADVWRAEILSSQYHIQYLQLEQQLRTARRWLQYALATQDSLWVGPSELGLPVEELPLSEWIERAYVRRAEYRLAEAVVSAAEANVSVQDALAISNPDIGVAAMQQVGVPFIGITVGWALPLLNRNQGERQKARVAVEQAWADRDRLRNQIATEVTVAYETYLTARQALDQARTVLAKASDVLQTVQMAYLKGATPIVDLLEAQRSWYETQRSYYDALADYWRSAVALLAASGQLSHIVEE
ncbi:MAG: TolC family protein [Chlorobi bacterium]|nr:TolC family protein [Chlorobiota bacterium]